MVKDKKRIVLMGLVILSILLITIGVTYAFFNYTKKGTTDNSITTGSITFLYTEVDKVGAGISITDAVPISDETGKALTGSSNVFNFTITSTTSNNTILYTVTARQSSESDLDSSVVKLYLTDTTSGTEEELLLDNYSSLDDYSNKPDGVEEKVIYNGKVPSNTDYEKNFKLRMWIDEDTDYTEGTYNDKTFSITVNVYSSATVITDTELALESSTNITGITADGTELTAVTGEDYDYEISLATGTTSTNLVVTKENENATVNIEKIDSLAISGTTSKVQRLSTKKTLDLSDGNNYFKVTVTSENKQATKEYKIRIIVGNLTLTESIMDDNTLITSTPTLTTSSNNTSDKSGLYSSTATNSGNPTYYFRGNVTNNYVSFAGFTWRIVRINEDGTIRLILQDGINNNTTYQFSSGNGYYTDASIKSVVESWRDTNLSSYSNYLVTGDYFCDQAKVKYDSSWTGYSASMTLYTSYTPNFKCSTDGNGKCIVNSNVALITYDEMVFAGGYYGKSNTNYYLYNSNINWWTMSTAGCIYNSTCYVWPDNGDGAYSSTNAVRPVIILDSDVTVTGTGTSSDPYVVQ